MGEIIETKIFPIEMQLILSWSLPAFFIVSAWWSVPTQVMKLTRFEFAAQAQAAARL